GGVNSGDSIEANPARGMLVAEYWTGNKVDIFDASNDCRNPVYKATYDPGGMTLHGLKVARDGRTFFATATSPGAPSRGPSLQIVDAADMAHPKLLLAWDPYDVLGNPVK